ncbi:BatA domain-containing protein [Tenacibaculum aquimarinum]|uniref:BatA domain-containing protein n=1 Tax=Tenacibaculum aquimarinum TaxID=2910675 RepID=UPI001F0B0D82|nr:BatA domain-containing protein [Tenacibaculum aquimarinum]MCH3884857.1 BatA domain-containing protein [Tenacibaculum aquimarinum]
MQFKHPEIFYFLALLIIPILVHLFQLQKFVKVPFTNVAFLQKLILQTRKSSKLKKWLILSTRLLALSAIIFAFTQPYFSNKKATNNQHNFIYLDNSLSTNTKGEKGDLLQISSQEIIETISNKDKFSLLTNDEFYKNISSSELKKVLLNITNTSKKLSIDEVLLKIESNNTYKTNTSNKYILISDFQNTYKNNFTNVNSDLSLIKLENSLQNNISIDSVFTNDNDGSNLTVNINIKNQGEAKENIPISIYNKQELISKQSFSIEKNTDKIVTFNIEKKNSFLGKINLTFNDTFKFDNNFYFTLNKGDKIAVLSIGKPSNYLPKIYQKNEFNFSSSTVKNVNYNAILKQQLVVLNEVEEIPQSLISSLANFSKNGGHLVIIPNKNINITSYNNFLKNLSVGKILEKKMDTLKITDINFKHPLLKNVFLKKVQNFQYPTTQNSYTTAFSNASTIVGLENKSPFIQQIKTTNSNVYFVNSSLEKENSNFTNSPLIVPVFYNIAQQSLQHSRPYYTVNNENKIDITTQLNKDDILSIKNTENSFIPLQQTLQNKVTLTTKEQPLKAGFYHVLKQKDTLKSIAFNYPKDESNLEFLDINALTKEYKNISTDTSVKAIFTEINKNNKVTWLWQWFLALAIVSLLLEILILKFFKA